MQKPTQENAHEDDATDANVQHPGGRKAEMRILTEPLAINSLLRGGVSGRVLLDLRHTARPVEGRGGRQGAVHAGAAYRGAS